MRRLRFAGKGPLLSGSGSMAGCRTVWPCAPADRLQSAQDTVLQAVLRSCLHVPGCCITPVVPCLLCLQVMSKPFTPGADRLANLKTHPSPVSGTPVLDTSNAILDCTVVSVCWDGRLCSTTQLSAIDSSAILCHDGAYIICLYESSHRLPGSSC